MTIKITGVVTGGKRLGNALGFPTANIILNDRPEITEGVYAAIAVIGDREFRGMVNIGRKNNIYGTTDTASDPDTKVLEINIFDFDEDIYGKNITVELLERIRGERIFASAGELKETVDDDRRTIQEYFKTHR